MVGLTGRGMCTVQGIQVYAWKFDNLKRSKYTLLFASHWCHMALYQICSEVCCIFIILQNDLNRDIVVFSGDKNDCYKVVPI
jgi:hypothetical protein